MTPPTDVFRNLFALTCHHYGGLGLPNIESSLSSQYWKSLSVSEPIVDLVASQCSQIPYDILISQSNTINLQPVLRTIRLPNNVMSQFDPNSHHNFTTF